MKDKPDISDEIVSEIKLEGGGILHRIVNGRHQRISTIWRNGYECWSCYRLNEGDMIQQWNERYGRHT